MNAHIESYVARPICCRLIGPRACSARAGPAEAIRDPRVRARGENAAPPRLSGVRSGGGRLIGMGIPITFLEGGGRRCAPRRVGQDNALSPQWLGRTIRMVRDSTPLESISAARSCRSRLPVSRRRRCPSRFVRAVGFRAQFARGFRANRRRPPMHILNPLRSEPTSPARECGAQRQIRRASCCRAHVRTPTTSASCISASSSAGH